MERDGERVEREKNKVLRERERGRDGVEKVRGEERDTAD